MNKILIANRGEIAFRIIKTCRAMDIATVAVYSEADAESLHAAAADERVPIGPAPAAESYLRGEAIIEAAKQTGADAIHPGFGFLSENADFARAVRAADLTFIGPPADAIEVMGSKMRAKNRVAAAGVPLIPGYSGEDQRLGTLQAEAEKVGYPLLIKASAGGGGKGMRIVREAARFQAELETAKREAKSAFGDDAVLLEKLLLRPRHIEIQVFGDDHGNTVHLFERECSIQRRHQKIIEETPSIAVNESLRQEMSAAAVAAARSVGYANAGTVEFMLDEDGAFYFLEMNTRLQVEHPITEMLTGQDLVRWQIEVARGKPLPLEQARITRRGHAIEARIYAEDPQQQFFPQTGKVAAYREPAGLGVRVDSGIREGDRVTVHYDPMLAKVIACGADREEARRRLATALDELCVHGLKTNIAFLHAILEDPGFIRGETTTDYLTRFPPQLDQPAARVDMALALTLLARPAGSGDRDQDRPTRIEPWTQLTGWRAS